MLLFMCVCICVELFRNFTFVKLDRGEATT